MSDPNNEINQFEEIVLDWFRTATIFFIAGIALYHFTKLGKPYTIIAFLLTIVLMVTMIVDYLDRRSELVSKGHHIRLSLDILIATMMVGLALVLWITWEVIVEPYPDNPSIDYDATQDIPLDTD
jgi:hypothetical protein